MTITTICSRVQNARETISGGRGQFQHHGQLVRGALPSNTAGKSEVSSNQEEHPPPSVLRDTGMRKVNLGLTNGDIVVVVVILHLNMIQKQLIIISIIKTIIGSNGGGLDEHVDSAPFRTKKKRLLYCECTKQAYTYIYIDMFY